MAVHNFNKTFTYVSAKYVNKSESDDTQIISSVTIRIDAVDQADDTKTITLEEAIILINIKRSSPKRPRKKRRKKKWIKQ